MRTTDEILREAASAKSSLSQLTTRRKNDALLAMNFPYPVKETAPKGGNSGRRLTDMELTMAFCTMGPGFDA